MTHGCYGDAARCSGQENYALELYETNAIAKDGEDHDRTEKPGTQLQSGPYGNLGLAPYKSDD